MTHTLVVNRTQLTARAALTGSALPAITLTHLSAATIRVAFASGSPLAQGGLGDGATARLTIKAAPTSDVLLMDASLTASGSGESAVYDAVWDDADLDSAALRTFLASAAADAQWSLTAWCEIEWTIAGSTERVCFPIQLRAAFHLPEDDAPDPASDAAWTWLKARLAAGSGITLSPNEETKVLTLAAATTAPANACTATISEDGLYLEFKTFAGVLIGKCGLNA